MQRSTDNEMSTQKLPNAPAAPGNNTPASKKKKKKPKSNTKSTPSSGMANTGEVKLPNTEVYKDLVPLFPTLYQPKTVYVKLGDEAPKKISVEEFSNLTAQLRTKEAKESSPNGGMQFTPKPWREGIFYYKKDEKEVLKLKRPKPKHQPGHKEFYTIDDINKGIKFCEESLYYRWRKNLGWEGFLFAGKTFLPNIPMMAQWIIRFQFGIYGDKDYQINNANGESVAIGDGSQFEAHQDLQAHEPTDRQLNFYSFTDTAVKQRAGRAKLSSDERLVQDEKGDFWPVCVAFVTAPLKAPVDKDLFLSWSYGYGGQYWSPNKNPFLFDNETWEILNPSTYSYQYNVAVKYQMQLKDDSMFLLQSFQVDDLLKTCHELAREQKLLFGIDYTVPNTAGKEKYTFSVRANVVLAELIKPLKGPIIPVKTVRKNAEIYAEPPADLKINDAQPSSKAQIESSLSLVSRDELPKAVWKYYPPKEGKKGDIAVLTCENTLDTTRRRDTFVKCLHQVLPEEVKLINQGLTETGKLQIQVQTPQIILDKLRVRIVETLDQFSNDKCKIQGWRYDFQNSHAILRVKYDKALLPSYRDLYNELLKLHHIQSEMITMWEMPSGDSSPRIEITISHPLLLITKNQNVFSKTAKSKDVSTEDNKEDGKEKSAQKEETSTPPVNNNATSFRY